MTGRLVRWLLSLAHGSRAGGAPRLTIIRHHRVYAASERPLYRLGVSEAVFERQLELLARAGLNPTTVEDGLGRLRSRTPGHQVAMTFDDGYEDNATRALPLLKRHRARGTFYLTAGLMEERRAPWWDELAFILETTPQDRLSWSGPNGRIDLPLADRASRSHALRALVPALRVPPDEQRERLDSLRGATGVSQAAPCELADWDRARAFSAAGMEVGAHTLHHPFLSLLAPAEQAREIAGSRDLIEQRLGVRCSGLAYPGGDYDAATVEVMRHEGFAYAVTTVAGDVVESSAPFELRRRGWSEGACLGPGARFSDRLARAELDGAFDGLRGRAQEAGT